MPKKKLTPEELRELRIVELAYELQFEECDDDDEEERDGVFDGELREEYYEMAKREIEEDEKNAQGK